MEEKKFGLPLLSSDNALEDLKNLNFEGIDREVKSPTPEIVVAEVKSPRTVVVAAVDFDQRPKTGTAMALAAVVVLTLRQTLDIEEELKSPKMVVAAAAEFDRHLETVAATAALDLQLPLDIEQKIKSHFSTLELGFHIKFDNGIAVLGGGCGRSSRFWWSIVELLSRWLFLRCLMALFRRG
ncbi:hypothetical protein V6N13_092086 [Hibiscus sabdariffa]